MRDPGPGQQPSVQSSLTGETPGSLDSDRRYESGRSSSTRTLEAAAREAARCLHCSRAPCAQACPLHPAIPLALHHIAHGEVLAAAVEFAIVNTMPGICSRLCPQERLCEGACWRVRTRARVDSGRPVAIGRLEAFATDVQYEVEADVQRQIAIADSGKHVAVVGAGPAGLTVAELTRRCGHAVTVFETTPRPGGALRWSIPDFRLAPTILDAHIAALENMGIRFICNFQVGRDATIDDLLASGYDAIFIGSGALLGITPDVLEESLAGVSQAMHFLERARPASVYPRPPDWNESDLAGKCVVVAGDSDEALDCARQAMRKGALHVICVHSGEEEKMGCRHQSLQDAMQEGVWFLHQAVPVQFLGNDAGHVRAVVCWHTVPRLSRRSGSRTSPSTETASVTVRADHVVLAIGRQVDSLLARTTPGLEIDSTGRIIAGTSGATSRPAIFAGGDCVHRDGLVVTAVADGTRAAVAIDRHFGGPAAATAPL
ncbi:MAG: FAD-dependent oxidoreductase [Chloroflexi bacterium]|nr:FAD-dependent oxidoreductase [Chloroflexota bacterium]